MRKKIYLDEIEAKSIELANFSKNDIANELEELRKAPTKLVWEGLAKEKYLVGYNKKVDHLIELNNNICKIAEFLQRVKDDYNGANEKINNAYEELIGELKPKEEN